MGNIVEDFLQTLYDIPVEILKKYPKAKVVNYKQTKQGEFDDWDMGVAGNYEAYVINGEDKQVAIIYYTLTVENRYSEDEEGNEVQNDFNSPTDAINLEIEKVVWKEAE